MDLQQLQPNRTHSIPMYLQLYQRFRDAIASGKLRPGERVPSVRNLASALNLARGTIEQAYHMLVSEGYFVTRGAAGTVISPQLLNVPAPGNIGVMEPPANDALRLVGKKNKIRPFQLGLPAKDAFPAKTWARLAGHHLRTLDTFTWPPPAGYMPLRQAIAAYVGISRGIVCAPEQVFITSGYLGALGLICRTLFTPGDIGWYEEPGYRFAREYLEQAGMALTPVPVNQEGIDVREGRRRAPEARFAVITPTHQSPTGATLSLSGRLALLEWANQQQAWIIEDDYDSEFRYHGKPLPALKSLDAPQRVIYAGTFSKALFPALRCAWLVVPVKQIAQFRHQASLAPCAVPVLWQNTLADFLREGHFWRHLKKMRQHYAQRRQWIEQALTQQGFQVVPQKGGIQMVIRMIGDDIAHARKANAAGLAVQALSDWRIRSSGEGGLLLSFTNIVNEGMARQVAQQLRKALS